MKFLDVNLTKDWSLLLHAFHSPLFLRILKKPILLSGFNNPYKTPQNKKTRVYSRKSFCRTEKWGQKTRQELKSEKASLCPEASTKNAVQEFYLWISERTVYNPSIYILWKMEFSVIGGSRLSLLHDEI